MAIIHFYKYVLKGNTEWVYRYTVPNLESMNIQYNTPISPMPLPEENAKENILVKIEGNSASVDIDWTLANYEYTKGNCHFQMWDSNSNSETLGVDNTNVRGKFNPVGLTFRDFEEPTGSYPRKGNSSKQIDLFKEYFESTSLNNDYLITIEDGDADGYGVTGDPMRIYGSPSQMSFSISGMSPVVWKARIQFFEGNVITVYDPDSPESPQDLSMVGHKDYGSGSNNDRDVFKVRFKDPTSFGATDTHTVTISYRRSGKLKWYSATYGVETTQGTNGTSTKLTKVDDDGADDGYYLVYLPVAAHETPLSGSTANAFLTSAGLFNTSTSAGGYAHEDIEHSMIGVDSDDVRKSQYYDVKVHFENSAGDGGTAEESAQTVE